MASLIVLALGSGEARREARPGPLERMRAWVGADEAAPGTIFADASVQGPSSRFRTVVLSGEDTLLFAQYHPDGSRTYAGIDRHGGWRYDAGSGRFSELGRESIAFLQAHDFHRTALAPLTRYRVSEPHDSGRTAGDSDEVALIDAAGGRIELSIAPDSGRPVEIRYPDHRGGDPVQVRPADWRKIDGYQAFRSLRITQGAERYDYDFQRISLDVAPLLQPHSAQNSPDAITLERFHHLDQLAHMAGDASLFTSHFDDPISEISGGQIRSISVTDAGQRFERYFDRVSFEQWRDMEPARMVIDSEAGHAHKLVRKEVVLSEAPDRPTEHAWLESWDRKADGSWRLTTIVSTRK